jgi:hypothetical protein
MSPAVRRAATVVALLLTLVACGVPADGTVRTVDPDAVPYGLLRTAPVESPAPTVAGPAVTVPQVYFLDDEDQLVPEPQPVPAAGLEPVLDALLSRLAQGPSEQQLDQGLGSALGPDTGLELVSVVDRVAHVQVTPSSQSPAADRIPLAIGQVVLTATSVDGVDRVAFVRDGVPLEVPLPGGARTSQPVSASDYASLLGPVPRAEKAVPSSPAGTPSADPSP